MQAMARVQGEIKYIPNNTGKHISFSLGNLKFIDILNFMMSSLDSLVQGSAPEDRKITEGEVRARPSPLLHSTRSEQGRAAEKDQRRAGALDRPEHAPVHRKRHVGWHLDGEQAVRKGQQHAGRRQRPNQAEQIHYVLGRKQPVRLGHEPASAQRRLQVKESDAHLRANHEA